MLLLVFQSKAMVCLSFSPVLEAEEEAETTSTEVKENREAAVVAAAEPLLFTLTLKKLMMLIRTVTY